MSIAKYSMPKQERFKGEYKRPLCDSIYEIPDNKSTLSSGIGYGYRRDIINRKETENMPSPLNYRYSSLFEENYKNNKGCSLSQKLPYKVFYLKNKKYN